MSGSAGHLIHREAVPLPLKGKDLTPLKLGETASVERFGARYGMTRLNERALKPSPGRGRGTALAVDEVCDSRTCRTMEDMP